MMVPVCQAKKFIKTKSKKKRFRKLWGNCVPLSNFKGQLFIDRDMVLDRRKKRYEQDNLLYFEHVKSKRENKIQITIKDNSLKSNYKEPYERKQEDFGCERDARTFNQPPTLVESDGAAEHENLITSQIVKQSSVAECTDFNVVGTTSSTSRANPNINAGEVIIEKGIGRFFDVRDFYTIITSSLRKYLKKAIIKSNSLRRHNSDCECDAQKNLSFLRRRRICCGSRN
jgi:hypothetical protein